MQDLYFGINVAKEGLNTFIGIFQQAMAVGREGAELQYTADKFGKLSEAAGTASDVLMRQLRSATKGLAYDAQLMGSATNFMALGLAKTSDEVVRLTKVSGALGMDMNQLVLTLTNQTTMRFDALGVSVDGFDERLKNLKATGMSTNEAFKEAFLQQAEAQVALLGEKADSTAAAFDRFDAATTNLANEIKSRLTPYMADAANGITTLIQWNEKVTAAIADHKAEVTNTSQTYEQYRDEMLRTAYATGEMINIEESQMAQVEGLDAATQYYAESLGILTLQEFEGMKAAQDWNSTAREQMVAAKATGVAVSEMATQVEDAGAAMQTLSELMKGDLGKEQKNYREDTDDLLRTQQDLNDQIDKLERKSWLSTKSKQELADLKAKLEEVQGKIKETADAHDEATKRILFGILQQQLAYDGLTVEEAKTLGQIAQDWGLIDESTKQAWDSIQEYNQLLETGKITAEQFRNMINGIPRNLDVKINVQLTGDTRNGYYDPGTGTWYGGGGEDRGGTGKGGAGNPGTGTAKPPPGSTVVDQRGAGGANFIVPPGYPADSYMMGVQSGEKVQVIPAGNTQPTGTYITMNFYGKADKDSTRTGVLEAMRATGRI